MQNTVDNMSNNASLTYGLAWVRLARGLIVIRKLRPGSRRGEPFRVPPLSFQFDNEDEVRKTHQRRWRRADRKARRLRAWAPAWAFGGGR